MAQKKDRSGSNYNISMFYMLESRKKADIPCVKGI